jgi:hypothetical protein
MSNTYKKLMKELAKKEVEKWVNKNSGFIEDFMSITNEIMMFEAKYGQRMFIDFEKKPFTTIK